MNPNNRRKTGKENELEGGRTITKVGGKIKGPRTSKPIETYKSDQDNTLWVV